EMATGELLVDSDYISPELKAARKDWLKVEAEAKKVPAAQRERFLKNKRASHFKKYPVLARMTEIMNTKNVKLKDLIELMPAMPYAKFNLEQFAKKQGLRLEDVFTNELTPNKIAILSSKKIRE